MVDRWAGGTVGHHPGIPPRRLPPPEADPPTIRARKYSASMTHRQALQYCNRETSPRVTML